MNLTIKELQGLIHDIFSLEKRPKKIKITSQVSTILDAVSKPVFKEMSLDEFVNTYGATGTIGQFESIPVEVDDTIDGNYELVY